MAVTPFGGGLFHGLAAMLRGGLDQLPPVRVGLLVIGAGLLAWLAGVLVYRFFVTSWLRSRHREILDLVAEPWPEQAGGRVLAHPEAVAYCLPGTAARVVLSSGAMDVLDKAELAAVVAHERAHLAERHDLVVLPFAAWVTALPWLPGVRRARIAVATLVEMLADDRACAVCDRAALATAVARVGSSGAPVGALAATGGATVERIHRLMDPPAPSVLIRLAAYVTAAALLGLPTLALVVS
jgi:Zn-dependent protease with chaperone function